MVESQLASYIIQNDCLYHSIDAHCIYPNIERKEELAQRIVEIYHHE